MTDMGNNNVPANVKGSNQSKVVKPGKPLPMGPTAPKKAPLGKAKFPPLPKTNPKKSSSPPAGVWSDKKRIATFKEAKKITKKDLVEATRTETKRGNLLADDFINSCGLFEVITAGAITMDKVPSFVLSYMENANNSGNLQPQFQPFLAKSKIYKFAMLIKTRLGARYNKYKFIHNAGKRLGPDMERAFKNKQAAKADRKKKARQRKQDQNLVKGPSSKRIPVDRVRKPDGTTTSSIPRSKDNGKTRRYNRTTGKLAKHQTKTQVSTPTIHKNPGKVVSQPRVDSSVSTDKTAASGFLDKLVDNFGEEIPSVFHDTVENLENELTEAVFDFAVDATVETLPIPVGKEQIKTEVKKVVADLTDVASPQAASASVDFLIQWKDTILAFVKTKFEVLKKWFNKTKTKVLDSTVDSAYTRILSHVMDFVSFLLHGIKVIYFIVKLAMGSIDGVTFGMAFLDIPANILPSIPHLQKMWKEFSISDKVYRAAEISDDFGAESLAQKLARVGNMFEKNEGSLEEEPESPESEEIPPEDPNSETWNNIEDFDAHVKPSAEDSDDDTDSVDFPDSDDLFPQASCGSNKEMWRRSLPGKLCRCIYSLCVSGDEKHWKEVKNDMSFLSQTFSLVRTTKQFIEWLFQTFTGMFTGFISRMQNAPFFFRKSHRDYFKRCVQWVTQANEFCDVDYKELTYHRSNYKYIAQLEKDRKILINEMKASSFNYKKWTAFGDVGLEKRWEAFYQSYITWVKGSKRDSFPLGVLITGKSDAGKSSLMEMIATYMSAMWNEDPTENQFNLNTASEFYEGFKPGLTTICTMDDLFLFVDPQLKTRQVNEVKRIVNEAPYCLNMAFGDKGAVFMDCKMMLASSNVFPSNGLLEGILQDPVTQTIAFMRTWHILIKVDPEQGQELRPLDKTKELDMDYEVNVSVNFHRSEEKPVWKKYKIRQLLPLIALAHRRVNTVDSITGTIRKELTRDAVNDLMRKFLDEEGVKLDEHIPMVKSLTNRQTFKKHYGNIINMTFEEAINEATRLKCVDLQTNGYLIRKDRKPEIDEMIRKDLIQKCLFELEGIHITKEYDDEWDEDRCHLEFCRKIDLREKALASRGKKKEDLPQSSAAFLEEIEALELDDVNFDEVQPLQEMSKDDKKIYDKFYNKPQDLLLVHRKYRQAYPMRKCGNLFDIYHRIIRDREKSFKRTKVFAVSLGIVSVLTGAAAILSNVLVDKVAPYIPGRSPEKEASYKHMQLFQNKGKVASIVKTEIPKASAAKVTDQAYMAMGRVYKKNLMRAEIGGAFNFIFFVDWTHAYIPAHIWFTHDMTKHVLLLSRLKTPHLRHSYIHGVDFESVEDSQRDQVLLIFKKPIQKIHDITQHLATDELANEALSSGLHWAHDQIESKARAYPNNGDEWIKIRGTPYCVTKSFTVHQECNYGQCASPYYLSGKGQYKVCGFIIATYGALTICTYLTKESHARLLRIYGGEKESASGEIDDYVTSNYPVKIIQDPESRPPLSRRSQFKPTPLHDPLERALKELDEEPMKKPARLKPFTNPDGEVDDPLVNALETMFLNREYDDPITQEDHEICRAIASRIPHMVEPELLQANAAVNSYKYGKYMAPLDLSTSAGTIGSIPKTRKKFPNIEKGKKGLLAKTDAGKVVFMDKDFCLLVNDTYEACLSGDHIPEEFSFKVIDFFKSDETLPPEKTIHQDEQGRWWQHSKPRIVSSLPLHWLIIERMIFGSFYANVRMWERYGGPINVGVNPYVDWTGLGITKVRKLCKIIRYIAGDFKKFDKTITPYLIRCFGEIVALWAEAGGNHDMAQAVRCANPIFGIDVKHLFGKYEFQSSGNVSGRFMTTILNSFVVIFIMFKAYEDSHPILTYTERNLAYDYIIKNIMTYGDDHVLPIEESRINFDMFDIMKTADHYGMTYTNIHKDRDMVNFVEADDLLYLQRKFEFQQGNYLAPLPITTLFSACSWMKKDFPLEDLQSQSREMMIRELAQYPKKEYELYWKIYSDANWKAFRCIPLKVPYSTARAMALSTKLEITL